MNLYDISIPLSNNMVVWPGEDGFNREQINAGEAVISKLSIGSHTGTHIDAPKHFITKGGSVDLISLNNLIGPCTVIEINHKGPITSNDVNKLENTHTRVIFKTSNTKNNLLDKKEFTENFISLDESAAKALIHYQITLVGVDYLSVEPKGVKGHPVHNQLLEAGVAIVEGCYLKDVEEGVYEIMALPLRITDGDGSPARVLLRK